MAVNLRLFLFLICSNFLTMAQALDDLTKSLTKDDCMNGTSYPHIRLQCCHEITLVEAINPNSNWRKCLKLVKKKGLDCLDDLSRKEKRNLLWSLVHCYYKRKKYIGPGQNFNMTRIKSDAAAMPDPFATKFIVDMYEHCALKANESLVQYELNNRTEEKDDDFHPRQTFFLLSYTCVNHYSETNACPYFHWAALSQIDNAVCQRYVRRCRQLMEVVKH